MTSDWKCRLLQLAWFCSSLCKATAQRMLYTMRSTQLYLDDRLWNVIHAKALSTGSTVSGLVRQSLQKEYRGDLDKRRIAMQAMVEIRSDEPDDPNGEAQVRGLRSGDRLERIRRA